MKAHQSPQVSGIPNELGAIDKQPDLAHVRVQTVAKIYDVSTATIWNWGAAGQFPKPHKIGPNCTRWRVGAGGAAIHCPQPLQPSAAKPSLKHQKPSGRQKSKIPACPFDVIRDQYHEALPELPRARLMGADRKRAIGDFWKWIFTETKSDGTHRATTTEQALDWTHRYFARASDNDFIMRRTARSAEHANWKADLDYLVSVKSRKQVIEKTGGAA